MPIITCQPFLRPALPQISGPKEYREERELFIRIDGILTTSGLEVEFIRLSMRHCGFDPAKHSARRNDRFCRSAILALRSNIARHTKGMHIEGRTISWEKFLSPASRTVERGDNDTGKDTMRRARWLTPWKDSEDRASMYHVTGRFVERRFAFGAGEKERFRTLMRGIRCG